METTRPTGPELRYESPQDAAICALRGGVRRR